MKFQRQKLIQAPRQLRIMEGLANKYRETYSPKMIDVTHEQNGAWDKVWRGGEGATFCAVLRCVLQCEDVSLREARWIADTAADLRCCP